MGSPGRLMRNSTARGRGVMALNFSTPERWCPPATAPATHRRRWTIWWLPAGVGAGLAAACAAGVLVGLQLSQPQISEADAVVAAVTEGLGLYADDGA